MDWVQKEYILYIAWSLVILLCELIENLIDCNRLNYTSIDWSFSVYVCRRWCCWFWRFCINLSSKISSLYSINWAKWPPQRLSSPILTLVWNNYIFPTPLSHICSPRNLAFKMNPTCFPFNFEKITINCFKIESRLIFTKIV